MLRFLLLALTALSTLVAAPKKITGDGKITAIQKTLAPFTRIKATGIGEIVVSKGTSHELNIKAESNILPYLKTEVKDDTLHIGIEEDVSLNSKEPITFFVSATDINYVRLYGANNLTFVKNTKFDKLELRADGAHLIEGKQLKAKELSVSIFGNITMELDGEVDILKIESQGTSSLNLEELKTKEAYIESQGVENIELNVQDFLKVRTLGVSNVTYKGNPKVKSWMSFTSSLRAVN